MGGGGVFEQIIQQARSVIVMSFMNAYIAIYTRFANINKVILLMADFSSFMVDETYDPHFGKIVRLGNERQEEKSAKYEKM